jgi:hypothetical protein
LPGRCRRPTKEKRQELTGIERYLTEPHVAAVGRLVLFDPGICVLAVLLAEVPHFAKN